MDLGVHEGTIKKIQSKEGKIIGLVTMEDLIEEVFGEIRDEHDIK